MEYENFRKLLKVRHLSIRVVAEAINMSDNGLNFAVQHDTIQSGKLKKLCDFLGMSPNEWYGVESGNTYNSSNVALQLPETMQLYSLRDTGIKTLLNNGVDTLTVMQAADHHNLAITTRYANHVDEQLVERLNKNASKF